MSDRVEFERAWKDTVVLSSNCDCHSPNHRLHLWMELQHDNDSFNQLHMTFYHTGEVWEPHIGIMLDEDSTFMDKVWYFVDRMKFRIRFAVRMLWSGYAEFENSFIFKGTQHVDDLIAGLQKGKELLLQSAKEIDFHVKWYDLLLDKECERCITASNDSAAREAFEKYEERVGSLRLISIERTGLRAANADESSQLL